MNLNGIAYVPTFVILCTHRHALTHILTRQAAQLAGLDLDMHSSLLFRCRTYIHIGLECKLASYYTGISMKDGSDTTNRVFLSLFRETERERERMCLSPCVCRYCCCCCRSLFFHPFWRSQNSFVKADLIRCLLCSSCCCFLYYMFGLLLSLSLSFSLRLPDALAG